MLWLIETSHMVDVPAHIEAGDLPELRRWVQELADSKKVRADRPAIGELTFTLQSDEHGTVLHAHFLGHNGKRRRFMRLRAERGALREIVRHRKMQTSTMQ